jgi:hypothetical protein
MSLAVSPFEYRRRFGATRPSEGDGLHTSLHESLRTHVCPVPTFDEAFFGSPFTE